jgi:hypothetical protein
MVSVRIQVNFDGLVNWGEAHGLEIIDRGHNVYDVQNRVRYGLTEHQIVNTVANAVEEILRLSTDAESDDDDLDIPSES